MCHLEPNPHMCCTHKHPKTSENIDRRSHSRSTNSATTPEPAEATTPEPAQGSASLCWLRLFTAKSPLSLAYFLAS